MKRRDFLKLATTGAAAVLALPACQKANEEVPTVTPLSSAIPTMTATLNSMKSAATIPHAETWNMVSQANGQEYRIIAGSRAPQSDTPVPVIYITDGNGNFPFLYILHQLLVDDGYLPPSLLVGVDFPFDEWDDYKDLRSRDFTPTILSDDSPFRSYFPAGMGGASSFLQFLGDELKPAINSKYNTLTTDATLTGHSLGGLFALYALFEKPTMFQRYVIGSPSIWYDDKTILNNMKAFSNAITDLSAHVFMGVGGNEDMATDMLELADTLMGYQFSNLALSHRVFEGETHLSMIPSLYSIGLRAVNQ